MAHGVGKSWSNTGSKCSAIQGKRRESELELKCCIKPRWAEVARSARAVVEQTTTVSCFDQALAESVGRLYWLCLEFFAKVRPVWLAKVPLNAQNNRSQSNLNYTQNYLCIPSPPSLLSRPRGEWEPSSMIYWISPRPPQWERGWG